MSSGDRLAKGLLTPGAWPHPVDDLQLVETHISWVVLTGDYAYKIKKPLELEFLDFSTLALRQHWCEEELRLNRRWAPDLYLDVVPITGTPEQPAVAGKGAPIEYAIRMRQFPQSALLSAQLDAGTLDTGDMRELAEMIADRHGRAPANTERSFGGIEAIRKPMVENFLYLEPWLATMELEALRDWTDAELDRYRMLIDYRRQAGFVRRCHGDLHLRNLVRLDDGIVAFDCVEFSEELRTLDVISDLTFLSMDLVASGRDDLAWVLLNRYLEVAGDYSGMQLYGLYHVYHCMIRAKVAAILAGHRDEEHERDADLETMNHYCDVARDWIETPRSGLILMHGLSGSGKTWVSTRLSTGLGAVRIRSDIERKRLHGLAEQASTASPPGEGLYDAATSERTYARLLDLAAPLLAAGHRVLIDATFLRREERERARSAALQLSVPVVQVVVEAGDALLAERLRTRAAVAADASEADAAVLAFQRTRLEPVDDTGEAPVLRFENEPGVDVATLVAAVNSLLD